MLTKSIFVILLVAISMAKTFDMVNKPSQNTTHHIIKKSLKDVTIKEATEDREIHSKSTLKNGIEEKAKRAVIHLGNQFKHGNELTKKHMENGHIKTEKMKKINPVLARKLNKMFEKIREFIKITKGVSKKIVKKDKISTSYDRTKDSFRQLTKFDLTVSVKILSLASLE